VLAHPNPRIGARRSEKVHESQSRSGRFCGGFGRAQQNGCVPLQRFPSAGAGAVSQTRFSIHSLVEIVSEVVLVRARSEVALAWALLEPPVARSSSILRVPGCGRPRALRPLSALRAVRQRADRARSCEGGGPRRVTSPHIIPGGCRGSARAPAGVQEVGHRADPGRRVRVAPPIAVRATGPAHPG